MINFFARLFSHDITRAIQCEMIRTMRDDADLQARYLPADVRVVRSQYIPWISKHIFRVDISGIALGKTLVFDMAYIVTLPMVMHELTHIRQQEQLGLKFFYRWFRNPEPLEAEAEAVETVYRNRYGDRTLYPF